MSDIYIETTEHGGRGYFSRDRILKDTQVLLCSSPFTFTIFRQFKKDVCSYCFKCDFYKPCRFKIQLDTFPVPKIFENSPKILNIFKNKQPTSAMGGLFFCSELCKSNWLLNEDPLGLQIIVLDLIDKAISSKKRNKMNDVNTINCDKFRVVNEKDLNEIWNTEVDAFNSKVKITEKITIDTAEHDTCRLVAIVVVKKYLATCLEPTLVPDIKNIYNIISDCRREISIFHDLQSNEIHLVRDFPGILDTHLKLFKFLKTVLLETPFAEILTPNLFRQIIGVEAGNAFGIWQSDNQEEAECLGSSIYTSASYFNHACASNIEKKRVGRSMEYISSTNIEKGQQLFISYGMFNDMKVSERQSLYLRQWHFKCECIKCLDELNKMQPI